MKDIITLFVFLFLFQISDITAQGPSNAERYNMFLQVYETYYKLDNQNGTNYVTFLMDAAVDYNGKADWLHNTSTGSGYSHSIIWNYDTPRTTSTGGDPTLLSVQDAGSHYYDLSFMAFQDNCGNRRYFDDCCGWACLGAPDQGRLNYYYHYNIKYQTEIGQMYTRWVSSGNSAQLRTKHAWRYHHGDSRLNPLTFNTLPDNQWVYHVNSNKRNPSGAPSYLGYLNNWVNSAHPDLTDAPDVSYSFDISTTRLVTISTNYSTTNFDTRLHLIKKTGAGNNDWEMIKTSIDISSANKKSQISEILEPGTYYVVVEGDNNETGKFYLRMFSQAPALSAGAIDHPEPWVREGCTLTRPIESTVPAATPFGTIAYQWQQKVAGATTWNNIEGANTSELSGAEVGNISEDMLYRRQASVGLDIRYTDSIYISSVPNNMANGRIQGTIKGRDGVGVVPGVSVYAIANPPVHGDCPDVEYLSITNANGQFDISDIYYGVDSANTQYKLYAVFEDHGFKPDTLALPGFMKSGTRNFTDQFIEDTTTIFINGIVTQTDLTSTNMTTCPVEGINFYLKKDPGGAEIFQTEITNENGEFGIPLLSVGDFTVRPDFRDNPDSASHAFSPLDSSFLNVIDDIDDVQFDDIERHTISGNLHACGDYRFGGVKLRFQDDSDCFVFDVEMDANGYFSKEVPAREYRISIVEDISIDESAGYLFENITDYFNIPMIADATHEDVILDYFYRQEPVIEIFGLEANMCGDTIVEQGSKTLITFSVTEANTPLCAMDTGVIIIIDNISEREQLEIPISNGIAQYEMLPESPNFFSPFTRDITIQARHIDRPELATTLQLNAIIEGYKQRESTFTTVSPQVPFIILRDPPGDESYAYLEEAATTELATRLFAKTGGSVSVWNKTKVGAKFEAGFLGFSTESHIWGEIEGSTSVSASNSAIDEAILTFTNGSRYTTSAIQDESGILHNADYYIGAAMNLVYAKADILEYNSETCTPETRIDLIMGNANMETQFRYSEYSLINSIIPSLEDLRDLQTEPGEINYYQNQINVWNQSIAENKRLKEIAKKHSSFPTNISWSGGGSEQEYFTNSTSTDFLSLEFDIEVEREIAAEIGLEVGGVGRSGGVRAAIRLEVGGSVSTSSTTERTTGFVLKDDDALDRYNTIVKECPVYGTPIFEDPTAITSCPYIDGTSALDGPQLAVVGPSIVSGIAESGVGVFTLRTTNASPDQKTRSYQIKIEASQGAKITTDGAGTFPILINNLPYGQSQDVTVAIERGIDPSLFAFEGVRFLVYPEECNDLAEDVTDEVAVSAYFSTTCNSVTMMEPQQGWITNSLSNNIRRIHLTQYDKTTLNQVIIQYTPRGQDSWNTALQVDASELNNNTAAGSYVDWNITNILDGEYEIRLKIICGSGTTFTQRVAGKIDRIAPVVFGIPSPIDDIYDQGVNDELSVQFEEDIKCTNMIPVLKNLETGDSLDILFSCSGNKAIITPIQNLSLLNPAAYRIIITGIEDHTNNIRSPYSWAFIVGDYIYDPVCSSVIISNNNDNQDAISSSIYKAIRITSDGTITAGAEIGYKAQESVDLEPGFTISSGGALEANIENCNE